MALSKRELFQKRRLRVRNKLRKMNAGRLRLSVHRSNKNISAQLIANQLHRLAHVCGKETFDFHG